MRYEFEQPEQATGRADRVLALAVRLAGVVLLAAGLWVMLSVLLEAWALYHEPERIGAVAQALARAGLAGSPAPAAAADAASALEPLDGAGNPGDAPAKDPMAGLAHLAAWPVALLTLLLAGHLALGAVRVGGLLALGAFPRPAGRGRGP